jgi:hypothetical protein
MKTLSVYLYGIVIGLWVGGMSIFTFLVTPVIFRAYKRDAAGEIAGNLFTSYFPITLAISAAALILLLLSLGDRGRPGYRISLVLVSLAVVMSLYVNFRLYPEVRKAKQEVRSFETATDDPARIKFRRLHSRSAVVNLLLIADGLVLLIMHMRIGK